MSTGCQGPQQVGVGGVGGPGELTCSDVEMAAWQVPSYSQSGLGEHELDLGHLNRDVRRRRIKCASVSKCHIFIVLK